MDDRGWSANDLAPRMGLSRSALQDRLNGRTPFSADEVGGLSVLFGSDLVLLASSAVTTSIVVEDHYGSLGTSADTMTCLNPWLSTAPKANAGRFPGQDVADRMGVA